MSILAQQLYGGVLNTDASEEPMRAERNPFGNLPSKEGVESPLFSGFTYAKDAEAASAFGNGADTEKSSPVALRTVGEDEILDNEATELTFFNTTTYGTPENFARLGNNQSTVLTNLAQRVNNGTGNVGNTWTNNEMKNSFTQDRSGTRMQLVRGEYDNTSGWKNELSAGTMGNAFTAQSDKQYSKENIFVGDLNAEEEVPAEMSVADLNGDGVVNFEDFNIFADEFAAANAPETE